MKKVLFLYLTILFFLSCSSYNEDLDTANLHSTNPFEYIGLLHNECIDSIKKQNIKIDMVRAYAQEFAEKHLMTYSPRHEQQQYTFRTKKSCVSILKRWLLKC